MSQMSEAAKKRMEELAVSESKGFNWTGVINKLRTGYYAYKLGILKGYEAGMQDPDSNKELLDKVEEFLRNAPLMSGVCCCGMEMKDHGFHHGHSAVDSGEYAIEQMIEKIREARK